MEEYRCEVQRRNMRKKEWLQSNASRPVFNYDIRINFVEGEVKVGHPTSYIEGEVRDVDTANFNSPSALINLSPEVDVMPFDVRNAIVEHCKVLCRMNIDEAIEYFCHDEKVVLSIGMYHCFFIIDADETSYVNPRLGLSIIVLTEKYGLEVVVKAVVSCGGDSHFRHSLNAEAIMDVISRIPFGP